MSRLLQKVRLLLSLNLNLLAGVLHAVTARWSNEPVTTSDKGRNDVWHIRSEDKPVEFRQKTVDSTKGVEDSFIQTYAFSLLTFIPNRAPGTTLDCLDLFVKSKATTFTMSSEYQTKKDLFWMHSKLRARKNPQIEGHSFQLDEQYKALHFMVSLKFLLNICEAGFHAGHSSYNFLTANPEAIVHSFDIGHWNITHQMARIVSDMFPERFSATP